MLDAMQGHNRLPKSHRRYQSRSEQGKRNIQCCQMLHLDELLQGKYTQIGSNHHYLRDYSHRLQNISDEAWASHDDRV